MLGLNRRRKCAKCGHSSANSNRSFHMFPKPGGAKSERAKKWAEWVYPEDNWEDENFLNILHKKGRMVCGAHFTPADFTEGAFCRLRSTAVPSIFSPDPPSVIPSISFPFSPPSSNSTKSSSKDPDNGSFPLPSSVSMHSTSASDSLSVITTHHPSSFDSPFSPLSTPLPSTSIPKFPYCIPFIDSTLNITPIQVHLNSATPVARPFPTSILKEINATRMKHLTPRKKKLIVKCRKQFKEIKRLQMKCKHMGPKSLMKELAENEEVNRLCQTVTPAAAIFLSSQLRTSKKMPKGRRWTLEEKLLSLTIFKKSPSCYRLLRRLFILPSQSTLTALLNSFPLSPGICKEMLSTLARSVSSMADNDKVCVLMFDEMSIKNHITYNPSLDCMDGFQDHGSQGRGPAVASYALVFMVYGLRKKWKHPIAYFFSGSPTSSTRIRLLLVDVLAALFSINLEVVATICDMGTNNVAALNALRKEKKHCFITIEEKQVATIFDVPHLLKCTRNMLQKHNVTCNIHAEINGQENVEGVAK